jgi:hydrogenase expression/formation protein HypC
MCLGIPGRVLDTWGAHGLISGHIDFAGVVKEVCLSYVPDVRVGEYVIVHVGFAITKVDEDEAHRTLAVLAEMGDLVRAELADDAGLPPGGEVR